MLKNVVFPAPLGPIRLTTEPRGMTKSTSFVATRPPNSLRTLSATRMSPSLPMLHVVGRRVGHAFVELALTSSAGDQAFGPDQHRRDDDQAVDPELVFRDVEARPERLVDRVPDVGE